MPSDEEHAALKAQQEAQHLEDEVVCTGFRAEAENLWNERKTAQEASKVAFAVGDKNLVREHNNKAKELLAAAEKAEEDAAEKIFAFKNKRQPAHCIDLHNLKVAEAVKFTERRLDADAAASAACDGPARLVIIYGAGNHSVGNKQAIKPAILDLLKSRGLQFQEDHNEDGPNPGCVLVTYSSAAALATTAPEPAPAPAAALEEQPAASVVVCSPSTSSEGAVTSTDGSEPTKQAPADAPPADDATKPLETVAVAPVVPAAGGSKKKWWQAWLCCAA